MFTAWISCCLGAHCFCVNILDFREECCLLQAPGVAAAISVLGVAETKCRNQLCFTLKLPEAAGCGGDQARYCHCYLIAKEWPHSKGQFLLPSVSICVLLQHFLSGRLRFIDAFIFICILWV